jgi:membrane protease YdiL (CAAX protease family)
MENSSQAPRSKGWLSQLSAQQNPPPWQLVDVGVLVVVIMLAMFILSSGVAFALVTDPQFITTTSLMVGYCVGLTAIIAYVWLTRTRKPEDRERLLLGNGLIPQSLVLLMGVAWGLTFDVLVGLSVGGFVPTAELRGIVTEDIAQLILAFVLVGILAPIAHGLAFCGVILPRLRTDFGAWGGNLATIALFAIYYFAVYGAQLPAEERVGYGVVLPVMWIFFAIAVRLRTQSTRSAIIAFLGMGITAWTLMLAL